MRRRPCFRRFHVREFNFAEAQEHDHHHGGDGRGGSFYAARPAGGPRAGKASKGRHSGACRHSAAWRRPSRRPAIPRSRSRSGCPNPDGTGTCNRWATAPGPGPSVIPRWRTALAAGYATASTDTGHTGGDPATFVPGHPEKVIDFSYRAVHEMTVAAKAIIQARYGNNPKYSYWNGCSTGGRQALTEAQRYAADYDGIIAGAAAIYTTHLQGAQVWSAEVVHKDEASYIPPAKYAVLHAAVLEACDAARRREGRGSRESHQVPLRSRKTAMQGRGCAVVSDGAAGGSRAAALRRGRSIRAASRCFPDSSVAVKPAGRRSPARSPWRWRTRLTSSWCLRMPIGII